jgi:hypothetical protein
MIIHLVVEGYTEEAVAERLLHFCGHTPGDIYGRKGCDFIRTSAVKFRHYATEYSGVLVLTDFRDAKVPCIMDALQKYIWDRLPKPPGTFLCRFAVNELESWLLADHEGLAKFLGINVAKLPLLPEREAFPKKTLVNLARASRKRRIRDGIAPSLGHRAAVGPDYMSLTRDFIINYWNIGAAMRNAPSLARCVQRLRALAQG